MTGDEPLSISWSFHGQGISSDLGILISPIGSRGSMLIISSVGHRHSGEFTCTARNEAGSKSETAMLKVNGMRGYNYAALRSQEGLILIKD